MEKTVKERLEMIPFENARKWALENCEPGIGTNRSYSISDAISGAFCWVRTQQGHEFWSRFCSSIKRMEQSIKLKEK